MKEPEPALLERCRQGDSEAFAQLVAEQQDYVYTLARRVLRDPEDAADLTQEVFLHVWQGLPLFRGEARFRTWLYRIVVNHCLNHLRRKRREEKTVSLEDARQQLTMEEDLAVAAWKEERRAWVWRQVERLPLPYRLVLNLFYQEELSCGEIAEVLGLPVGTVKTHLFRARQALAEALPQGDDDAL
jgi:RNA polymerase sigma-70 factor (ECF subfamily)